MLRRRRVDGCGLIEAYITVEHGKIAALTFKGDFFSASEPDERAGGAALWLHAEPRGLSKRHSAMWTFRATSRACRRMS